MWQLNLESFVWTDVTSSFSVESHPDDPVVAEFPATAAAVAVPHRGRALLIGGHVKDKDVAAPLAVRVLDPARSAWSVLHCDGEVPRTRGSHAACIIGDRIYVVGGERPNRRLQAGVQVLDLVTNSWSPLVVEGQVQGPAASSALVVAAYLDRCAHLTLRTVLARRSLQPPARLTRHGWRAPSSLTTGSVQRYKRICSAIQTHPHLEHGRLRVGKRHAALARDRLAEAQVGSVQIHCCVRRRRSGPLQQRALVL